MASETASTTAAAAVESETLGTLEVVRVKDAATGAAVKVAKYGGTVVSFVAADGEEKLFVSEKAVLDGSKAVRGGVPLVFPQFGGGMLPSHGFARTSMWVLGREPAVKNGLMEFSFKLGPTDETRELWPHDFALEHVIRFGGNVLETSMHVTNPGESAFEFQTLLHTYYRLADITAVEVTGLNGLWYLDQLQDRAEVEETRDPIQIAQETDAIYLDVKEPVVIGCGEQRTDLRVTLTCDGEERPCDVVLWNPWVEKAQRTADMGDAEYHNMICVEPGLVSRFEKCEPKQSWVLTQHITFFNSRHKANDAAKPDE
mmetsp:Transcript_24438/g.69036  ORF Transcript_24438/g.69036 Transcript_24438/m.69036 type:complete len:314 (-) Transcript_24438:112-1053(-)